MATSKGNRPALHLVDDQVPRGPWVYGRQVVPPTCAVEPGQLVEVLDRSERFLGHALYNPQSDIRLRWLSRGRRRALDRPRDFLLQRLRAADRLRRRTLGLQRVTDAYRIAHAEGDDLSGLVVDKLGSWLVCEFHALGMWNVRRDIVWALGQLYPELGEERVVLRVPESARRNEGIVPSEAELAGGHEEIITEHGLRFPVLVGAGHKTGWFCDQRENRQRVAALAEGRSVLDLCCNAGGFSLAAARAGARHVEGVDLDEKVLERAQAAAVENGLDVSFVHADAFHLLRDVIASSRRPELIVVDPHKLIRGRADREKGERAYLDLNALALQAVRSEGLIATFSCSGALDLPAFLGILFAATRRAEREVRLLDVVGAGPDHPQRGGWAGTRYLKGALLAVD